MLNTPTQAEMPSLLLRTRPLFDMSDDEFYALCHLNPELRMERTAKGEINMMSPAGGETSRKNARLIHRLQVWADEQGQGVVFDSSGGFQLPNGAIRSPDAAWVLRSRLMQLTFEQKQKFLPLAPDFVVELRSPSDRAIDLQDKLQEYVDNGVRVGWLVDPIEQQVLVYRPGKKLEQVSGARGLSGYPELPGFLLNLVEIWEPGF